MAFRLYSLLMGILISIGCSLYGMESAYVSPVGNKRLREASAEQASDDSLNVPISPFKRIVLASPVKTLGREMSSVQSPEKETPLRKIAKTLYQLPKAPKKQKVEKKYDDDVEDFSLPARGAQWKMSSIGMTRGTFQGGALFEDEDELEPQSALFAQNDPITQLCCSMLNESDPNKLQTHSEALASMLGSAWQVKRMELLKKMYAIIIDDECIDKNGLERYDVSEYSDKHIKLLKLMFHAYKSLSRSDDVPLAHIGLPLIHFTHLFTSEELGYHYENRHKPVEVLLVNDANGIYGGLWKRDRKKNSSVSQPTFKFSSFFPKTYKREDVINVVNSAFANPIAHASSGTRENTFVLLGRAENGLIIEMFVEDDIIAKPYPILSYTRLEDDGTGELQLAGMVYSGSHLIELARQTSPANIRYELSQNNRVIIDIAQQIAHAPESQGRLLRLGDRALDESEIQQLRGIYLEIPRALLA